VALIKCARHPNAAKLFMDYLLSEEGQYRFASDGLAISTKGYEHMVPEEMRWRVLLGPASQFIESLPQASAGTIEHLQWIARARDW